MCIRDRNLAAHRTNPNFAKGACCLIHAGSTDQKDDSKRYERKSSLQEINYSTSKGKGGGTNLKDKPLTIHEYMTFGSKFSGDLINFLCLCLRFDATKRPSAKTLLSHPFLSQSSVGAHGPDVSLANMVQMSVEWNRQQSNLPLEFQGPSERQLDKVCDALAIVLPNCDTWFTDRKKNELLDSLWNDKKDCEEIKDLSHELGLPTMKIKQRLRTVFSGLSAVKEYFKMRMENAT
eukprot:TRINITY_DN14432_c0_g1_i1.p1 TRINITY_DN14432_c0_g1~~TRINITY_DN14432_c0_g1_i1.p1  ORF type:complete len:234 (+),score=26.66 TRINITY_DN14432_c0_g1_i1:62-763(+)